MLQTQTITTPNLFLKELQKQTEEDPFLCEPSSIVDMALHQLQKAGVALIEWRSLLYRRMNVPVVIKDYSYVVPDELLEHASDVLSTMGLPLATPSRLLLKREGDFQAKGRFHRITRYSAPSSVQHLALYPLSFTTLKFSECEEKPPCHILPQSSLCRSIFVPSQPAMYSSILRLMLQYPQHCSTMTVLRSDLSELIGYDLLELAEGYIDDEDWEAMEVDKRLTWAAQIVRGWGPQAWRKGEDWMADALAAVAGGSGSIEYLPHSR